MKYLILLLLLLPGCVEEGKHTQEDHTQIDKDLAQIRKQTEENQLALDHINCEIGVSFTVSEFRSILTGKVKQGQIQKIFDKCEELK